MTSFMSINDRTVQHNGHTVIEFPLNWSYILMTNYFSAGKDYNRSLNLDYAIFCTQN